MSRIYLQHYAILERMCHIMSKSERIAVISRIDKATNEKLIKSAKENLRNKSEEIYSILKNDLDKKYN